MNTHNIIFQCSLYDWNTNVPDFWKCMDTSREKLLGCYCSHSCTICFTSLSDLKTSAHPAPL